MLKKISFLFLALAIILIFRKFFIPGPLVWGDAPYFYKEGLKELIALPNMWTTRGNTFGGVNLFIWIYPLMLLYGAIGNFLHLGNDIILRVLFYFPSLIFGFFGTYSLTKYLKLSNTITFFAILIYLVNTHFLLIIDGGQVGLALAYGFFPLALYLLVKFIDDSSIKNFLMVLISGFFLTVVDFRISAIYLFTASLLKLTKPKEILKILLVAVCILGLSSYWIIPALGLPINSIETSLSGLQTTSLLNSLFLFSPNWPSNQFGQIIAPYFYFALIPVLIFAGVFLKNAKKYYFLAFVFLIFAFLSKGTTPPLGNFYSFLVNTEFGSVFRDSTKFFIPLMLFAGILIGLSIEEISKKLKNVNQKKFFQFSVYLFILFLVWQGLLGKLNGVLGKNSDISDFQKVYNLVSSDKDNFERTVWFTEKSPFAFHTQDLQSIDAKDLVNFRPFASMNVGTSDRFNFINNPNFLDWFDLFGIKYLILSGNPRITNPSESDIKDWNRLTTLLSNNERLQKVNVGTNFPIYKNPSTHPNKFFVDKVFVVIGSDNIYDKLKNINPNFSVGNSGFLFVEDGKLDPSLLQNIASTSAVLLFNDKTKDDLKMSFLQKYFVGPESAINSQWSIYKAEEYLKYKYELLTKDIKFNDFDYNLGVAFSTIKGEKINFDLDIPTDGNYILTIRSMNKNNQNMHWETNVLTNLKKGKYRYSHENKSGFEILNTVALIPQNEMSAAENLTKNFLGFFESYNIKNKDDLGKINKILQNLKWEPTKTITEKPGWVIFTDSYNPKWVIQKQSYEEFASYPFYSAVNGFYIKPDWGETKLIFNGRNDLRWGIYWSVISFLIIILGLSWVISKNERKN